MEPPKKPEIVEPSGNFIEKLIFGDSSQNQIKLEGDMFDLNPFMPAPPSLGLNIDFGSPKYGVAGAGAPNWGDSISSSLWGQPFKPLEGASIFSESILGKRPSANESQQAQPAESVHQMRQRDLKATLKKRAQQKKLRLLMSRVLTGNTTSLQFIQDDDNLHGGVRISCGTQLPTLKTLNEKLKTATKKNVETI